jgi:hypothetical protein
MLFSKINLKTGIIILMTFFTAGLFFIRDTVLEVYTDIDNLLADQTSVNQDSFRRAISKTMYTIDFGGQRTRIEEQLSASEDSTVFSLLQDLAQKRNLDIETSYYEGMGVLVESIDMVGNKGAGDDRYWQYWVNGELPMVSSDKMQVEKDDVVEWKFEPVAF